MKIENIYAELINIDGYMQYGQGIVLGFCEKEHNKNYIWIDAEDARADYVADFEQINIAEQVDFIRAWNYIQHTAWPINAITRMIKTIKPGGYLLIIQSTNPLPGAKHYFNYGEMEGILSAFDFILQIDARGVDAEKTKSYFYVCRKKNIEERIESGKKMEQENEAGAAETA